MQDQANNNSLQDKVLQAIKSGEIKAKPKWHFYAQSMFLAFGVLFTALLLLFFASLIIYSLRQNGAWFAPGFGWYGIKVFFVSLPWLIIGVVVLLLFILEWMLRRYKFAYQRPLLYTFVGLGMVFTVGTAVISRSEIHEILLQTSRKKHIMLGEPLYKRYGMPYQGEVTVGKVIGQIMQDCNIETKTEEILRVIVNPKTVPYPDDYCVLDNIIMVLGPRQGNTITAVGIKKLDAQPHYFYFKTRRQIFPTP